MTNEKRCDIIGGSLSERKHPERITKKVEKLLKNLLTNGKRCDIIVGHFRRVVKERFEKNLEKFSKNFSKTP